MTDNTSLIGALMSESQDTTAYSMGRTVKYALFYQFSKLIEEYSKWVVKKENDAVKQKLLTDLRTMLFLIQSAFGSSLLFKMSKSESKLYPNLYNAIAMLRNGDPNFENNSNINLHQMVYEIATFLNVKNVTNLSTQKSNVADAFGGK